ncbi:MAG: efflux RND transporter periplasmic adaptor subunit [Magnetococcales bacterium]|nr:efflux RND transporter periplasmic adaptor subunit [Magnetococcales bacterium]
MIVSCILKGQRTRLFGSGLALAGIMTVSGWVVAAEAPSRKDPMPQASTLTEIRGYLVPRIQTTLAAQIDAQIQTLSVKEGDAFAAGTTLIAFDCTTLNAQLQKAKTALQAAKEKNVVMQRLAKLHSVGTMEADASRAEQAQAEAEVKLHEARQRGCRIQAPFVGKVAALMAREHQYVTPGVALMKIIDHRHLEMEMVVPSFWLRWLKPKMGLSIHIDETGKDYPAQLIRLAAEADPVSQTVKIVAEPTGEPRDLLPGMSGVATFSPPEGEKSQPSRTR